MRIQYPARILAAFALAASVLALLAGCSRPETPQEVTQAFWGAAVDGDGGDVARYSTLGHPDAFDGFARDWEGYRPSWGRVIIDGDQASVVSEFARPDGARDSERSFVTYLVRRDDTWLVDYDRTARSVNGGLFGDMFNQFDRLSREFSRQFDQSTKDANAEVERMLEELEGAGQELGKQASEALERYSEELDKALQEMEQSIEQSLEEDQNSLPAPEQKPMDSAAVGPLQGKSTVFEWNRLPA
ncbi:hypothetical protein [Microbulbifer sp. JSM ZJ756]|uniref:hypothetical protein n=1 Tax=Microbulbifer sp. JSM ZJ756 TaxID=3376191 RepID=UPI0037B71170